MTAADLVVETTRHGAVRREEYTRRSDGRYDRVEKALTKGGDYRPIGHDVVDDVTVRRD